MEAPRQLQALLDGRVRRTPTTCWLEDSVVEINSRYRTELDAGQP